MRESTFTAGIESGGNPESPVDVAGELCRQAAHCAGRGEQQAAAALYEQGLALAPDDPVMLNNYGLALMDMAQFSRARGVFERLLAVAPHIPAAHYNAGNLYLREAKPRQAMACFRRAVDLRPDYFEAWYGLGVSCRKSGLTAEAIAAFQHGAALEQDADNYFQLGVTLHATGRVIEAEAAYRQAINLNNQRPDYFYNLGIALQDQKNFGLAGACFQKVIAMQPDNAKAYNNLGLTLQESGDSVAAKDVFLKALELAPGLPEAHNNLGHLLMANDEHVEAETVFKRALELSPTFSKAWYNLATCLQARNEIEKAIAAFRKTIELAPDLAEAHWNLSHALLLSGNYKEGFREYLWRWRRPLAVKTDIPLPYWHGELRPDATILVHTEQGAGDSIQFIRYLSKVAERVNKIILVCEDNLVELFQSSGAAPAIVGKGGVNGLAQVAQCHCPLLDLPSVLETDLDTIPTPEGYLRPPADLHHKFAEIVSGFEGLRVGVVWQGNPQHLNDHRRSIPYAIFRQLFDLPGITFYSLNKASAPEERDSVSDLAPHLKSFAHTAAAMSHLDLIISIDTSGAHLAGALGLKTWTLLPYVPDWRWMLERQDTPWYASMRLFRQAEPGDWPGVVERLKVELASLAGLRR